MHYLDFADVLLIASEASGVSPETVHRVARPHVIQRALMAQEAEIDGRQVYAEVEMKASVLYARLAQGNVLGLHSAAIAWLCMREFIYRNGLKLEYNDPDDVVVMLESVAGGLVSEVAFASWIRDRLSIPDPHAEAV